MTIATFGDLKTQIASWLARTDFTDAQLGQFVSATEADLRNDMECRESEQMASGTMVGDGFTTTSDFLNCRTLVVDGVFSRYLSPELYAREVEKGTTSGYYTISGNVFSVLGGDGQSYELLYRATLTPLVSDADFNWVLTNASNLYLFGGCKYGSIFLKDVEAASGYATLYANAIAQLNRVEKEAKYGGPLIVRTESYTP